MTTRSRRQRGTLERRASTWFLRVRDAADPSGARRRIRVELGSDQELRSEAAARRAADAWLARRFPESLTSGTHALYVDYLEHFLAVEASLYRASSRRRYASVVRQHLVPALGSRPLSRIDTPAIKAFMAQLNREGLRRSTVAGIRAVLLHTLRQARSDGYDAQAIDGRLVRLPKSDIVTAEPRYISAGELERMLAASGEPWRALWGILGFLGLRIAEALGLAWEHLELEGTAPLVRIRQSASMGLVLPLKTATSRADLPLPEELAALLRAYRAVWRPNEAGLLFATASGRPMQAENIRARQLLPLLGRLGLPAAGFHAFRHGRPRVLFEAGCSPAVVQRLMRHASLRMTERYTHTSAEDLRAAVASASKRTQVTRSELEHSRT